MKTYHAHPSKLRKYSLLGVSAGLLAAFETLRGDVIGGAITFCVAAGFGVFGVARRRRPVVRIDREALVHYKLLGDPVSIPITDIAGVAWDGGTGHIGVHRRTQTATGLDLRDLSESQRTDLKADIEALAGPAAG